MKRVLTLIALTLFASAIPGWAFAQEFISLTRLPGIDDFTKANILVNGLITITIVGAALLAVIQIIRGGFVYLTTEAISSKGDARGLITDALTGLLLVLVSVLILTIINPDILNIRFLSGGQSSVGTDEFSDADRGGPITNTILPNGGRVDEKTGDLIIEKGVTLQGTPQEQCLRGMESRSIEYRGAVYEFQRADAALGARIVCTFVKK